MVRARSAVNPYASRNPKPKIVDLIGLLAGSQRASYQRIVRSMKRLPGVHGELNYFGAQWGWALRYRRGDATLCTVHFLPRRFEATVTVNRTLEEWAMGPNHISQSTKRDLHLLRRHTHTKWLRIPVGSERRAKDLVRILRWKVTGR
jgi:hypothetical protein